MMDTGDQKYSIKEAINRILRVFIGSPAPYDAPETLAGSVLSTDGAVSKLAEVLEGKDGEETFHIPDVIANDITTDGTVFVGDNNGAVVLDNYGIFLTGTATVWDDLRFPALALRVPAAGAAQEPDLVQFIDDGGSSTGVFSYAFDPATEEEMYFAVQMPHSWVGSPIYPHVHWSILVSATGTVGWGMEYTWAGVTGTFSNTALIYSNTIVPAGASLVAHRHYLTPFQAITGSFANKLSSMIVGRIFRDATGSGTPDSCPEDAILLEVDFHYEQHGLGSREQYHD